MGKRLNLKDPKTFNEKIQWLKIYGRRPIDKVLSDKYAVKQYISDTLGSEYVIPLLGNSQDKRKNNRNIKQRIKEIDAQDSTCDNLIAKAYLLVALYISTHDAQYRTELKPIVMQQLPPHKALREFLSLIRK